MVLTLLRLRGALLANSRSSALWASAALGLISALTTLALGFANYPSVGGGVDVLAFALALWVAGRVAYAAFAGGDPALRPELFRLLPIPRRRLARALLVVGLADPALVLLALASASLVVLGARQSAGAALAGVLGALLTVVLASVLATVVGGLVPAASRRRRDAGTVVMALAISVVAVMGTLLPTLSSTLTHRDAPWLSAVLRVLPSGWAAVAVDAAARGDALLVVLPLLGLVALIAAAAACWPWVLSRRLEGAVGASGHGRRRSREGRALLPRTATGAVVAKELRLWARDPLRSACLLIAALVGIGVCVIPRASEGSDLLLPFAGAISVVIAGACACNLYGSDGLALRLVVATPASAGSDVRGRQAAWLLIVAPYALLVTAVLTGLSGEAWSWPWVAAGLPALLGGASGLVPFASVIGVQPLDDGGGPTPAWPLKVYATLFAIVLTALPAAVLLTAGAATGDGWLSWLGVPAGIFTGGALAVWLGRSAARRLQRDQLDILVRLAR